MKKINQTVGRIQLGNFAPEFAHLAAAENVWLEPVSNKEYNNLK